MSKLINILKNNKYELTKETIERNSKPIITIDENRKIDDKNTLKRKTTNKKEETA